MSGRAKYLKFNVEEIIPPFIKADGTLYTFESDAYLETLPFRSDATVIANNRGNYLTDLDNPNLSHHSNLFKHSADPNYWFGDFGYGDFGVGYTMIDRHEVFSDVKTYGDPLTYPNASQPRMARYSLTAVPIGESSFPIYYEHAHYIYPDDNFTSYADDYIYASGELAGEDLSAGWYRGYGGRYGTNLNPVGNIGFGDFFTDPNFSRWTAHYNESGTGGFAGYRNEVQFSRDRLSVERVNPNGGFDAWELRDRGPQVTQDGNRPAYYENNPSNETIGAELDHIPNVRFVNYNQQTTVDYPFGRKPNFNNLYEIAGDKSNPGSLESQRRSKTYDAVFYVDAANGSNTGAITREERKNNKTLPYQSLPTAWSNAYQWQETTGEKTLVWMMTGVHTVRASTAYPVDLYYDYKAIHKSTSTSSFGAALSDLSTIGSGNFDILGHGIFYNNTIWNTTADRNTQLGGRYGIEIHRGGRMFGNIQAEFVDQLGARGAFGGAWHEPEFQIKQYWSRGILGGGVGTWSGDITFMNTAFLHGITSDFFIDHVRRRKFVNCVFTSPYIGAPDLDIYDIDQNIIDTAPMVDVYDTSGFSSSQEVADDFNFLETAATGGVQRDEIKALVEIIPRNQQNFTSTITLKRYEFDGCTFLINKEYIFALALLAPFAAIGFSNWGERQGNVYLRNCEVYDWSGAQNVSAFFASTFYTTATRDNPYLFVEEGTKWTGDNFGWTKYINSQSVINPILVTGGVPTGWANGTYGQLPNASTSGYITKEADEAIDITGATNNTWSLIDTNYPNAELELLVTNTTGTENAFFRKDGSTATGRGGTFETQTQTQIKVRTNILGQFEIFTTNVTTIQVQLIGYITNTETYKQ